MKLSRGQVRDCVIESLREIIGVQAEEDITDKTNPIINLGLDSFTGVDYACSLSVRLKYIIPFKINPFVNDELNQPRNVGEIVDLMCGLLAKEPEAKND